MRATDPWDIATMRPRLRPCGTIDRQRRGPYTAGLEGERVAQTVEHVTFNHGVLGSSPSALTRDFLKPAAVTQSAVSCRRALAEGRAPSQLIRRYGRLRNSLLEPQYSGGESDLFGCHEGLDDIGITGCL